MSDDDTAPPAHHDDTTTDDHAAGAADDAATGADDEPVHSAAHHAIGTHDDNGAKPHRAGHAAADHHTRRSAVGRSSVDATCAGATRPGLDPAGRD